MTTTPQTLPAVTGGTDVTRFNALRHGVLSRYTVLPWEDSDEYLASVTSLVAEHVPGARPRSIWSRSSPAFSGASGGCGSPRLPPIGGGSTGRWHPIARRSRRRWCI